VISVVHDSPQSSPRALSGWSATPLPWLLHDPPPGVVNALARRYQTPAGFRWELFLGGTKRNNSDLYTPRGKRRENHKVNMNWAYATRDENSSIFKSGTKSIKFFLS
jgi:hypothetical protein